MRATAVPSLTFLGAAQTVTGSRFLLDLPDQRVLVDCGLYQGDRALRRLNWARMPVPAHSIGTVVLTHAHLDHSGALPRLVREGFGGEILCSPWTARVAPIVLRDAAHLQEEDAEHAALRGYSRYDPPLPLFTMADAERAIELLRPVPFGQPHPIAPDVMLTLHRAGHILGSSTVELRTATASVGFTGDLGRRDHPLLAPPDPAPQVAAMVVESTYGDRTHPARDLASIATPVCRALDRGGVVLIPAFAIDRTPVLLMALRELTASGAIPTVPIYVDSPMALAALEVYRDAVREGGPEIRAEVRDRGDDPFDAGDLRLAHSAQESTQLDEPGEPCIIISASGMATGGRVVHHLEHIAPQERNLILLPGFQVPGTRGRQLLDGARTLKMHGGYVPVRAEVVGISEFSAHIDAPGMLDWLRTCGSAPKTCYVVHGEAQAASALVERIDRELGWCAVAPSLGERVLL